jgi:hypothetical protein
VQRIEVDGMQGELAEAERLLGRLERSKAFLGNESSGELPKILCSS